MIASYFKLPNTVSSLGRDVFSTESSTGIKSSYTADEIPPIAYSVTVNTLKEHNS